MKHKHHKHHGHHGHHGHHSMHEHHSHVHHSMYEHEVDHPEVPKSGHMMHGMGCEDFKKDAMDIAYGQAGKAGVNSDMKKIHSQMKHYTEDANSGY